MVNSICVCVCITWPWPLPKRPCVSLAVTKCGPCRFTSSHSRTSCLMAGRGHQAPPPFSTRTLKRAMEHSLLIGSRWRHFERPQTRVVDSVEKSNTTEPVPLSDFWLVGFFFNTWNLKKNENWNCSERNPSWRHCQYVGHLRWQAKKNIEDEPISIKLYPKQKKRFDRVNQNNFQGFFFNFWVSFEDVRSIFFFVGSRVRWKCFVIFFVNSLSSDSRVSRTLLVIDKKKYFLCYLSLLTRTQWGASSNRSMLNRSWFTWVATLLMIRFYEITKKIRPYFHLDCHCRWCAMIMRLIR